MRAAGADPRGAAGADVEPLVGVTVAVVVDPVAQLRRGPPLADARPPADLLTGAARPDAFGLCGVRVTGDHRGPLVGRTVAIVVGPVADLRTRSDLPHADHLAADPLARAAGPHARRARVEVVAGLGRRLLVEVPVAIVVDVVAQLGGAGHRVDRADALALEAHPPGLSDARARSDLAHLADREALVDACVAVVVHRVAHLVGGAALALADVAVARAGPGVAQADPIELEREVGAAHEQPLVGVPVAVVVHAVAHLVQRRPGLPEAARLPLPVAHHEPLGRAGAHADLAGLTDVEVLIGAAVAVVVEVVAPLGHRLPGDGAAAQAPLADRLPGAATGAEPHRARLPGDLVDATVAVVVQRVADLTPGQRLPLASPVDALLEATLDARAAGTDPRGPRWPGVTPARVARATGAAAGDALVHHLVAVVVALVAHLRRRRALTHARRRDAGLARAGAADALPDTDLGRGAVEAERVDPLVGGPVAVVVEAVARIVFAGADRAGAHPPAAVDALLEAGPAFAHAQGVAGEVVAGALQPEARSRLVEPAIAVVVEAVARLGADLAAQRVGDRATVATRDRDVGGDDDRVRRRRHRLVEVGVGRGTVGRVFTGLADTHPGPEADGRRRRAIAVVATVVVESRQAAGE